MASCRKALRLSNTARRTTTVGEIVNLMSVDSQKLHDMCTDIHEPWAAPIMIIISMVLLWNIVGPSSFAGLVFLILLAPVNGAWLVRRYTILQVSFCGESSIYDN